MTGMLEFFVVVAWTVSPINPIAMIVVATARSIETANQIWVKHVKACKISDAILFRKVLKT